MKVEPSQGGFILIPETQLERETLLDWAKKGIRIHPYDYSSMVKGLDGLCFNAIPTNFNLSQQPEYPT